MTTDADRVVFDCNILFQAIISAHGPADKCIQLAREGRVILFVSDYVFAEVLGLSERPILRRKFHLDAEKIDAFLAEVRSFAVHLTTIPSRYEHPIDPKDSHYVNLALAADSKLIVSRDNHLLMLKDADRQEGLDFQRRFPGIRILDPVEFLRELEGGDAVNRTR